MKKRIESEMACDATSEDSCALEDHAGCTLYSEDYCGASGGRDYYACRSGENYFQ